MLRRWLTTFLLAVSLVPAFAQAPPPIPALPDAERRTSYNITSSTCACSVGFQLYGDGTDYQNWVTVWINGTQVQYNDATYGWTITSPSGPLSTHYRPITDAILTFNSAQTGVIQIVGARRPRRTNEFTENRGVSAHDLNQILNDTIAIERERYDIYQGRLLQVPPGDSVTVLPKESARAGSGSGTLLGFDSSGNPTLYSVGSPGSGNVTGPGSSTNGDFALFGATGSIIKDGGPSTVVNATSPSYAWIGPVSGSAANATFRPIVATDLPELSGLSGTISNSQVPQITNGAVLMTVSSTGTSNWIVTKPDGTNLCTAGVSATTTQCLQEAINYAANNGLSLFVYGAGAIPQGSLPTWTLPPSQPTFINATSVIHFPPSYQIHISFINVILTVTVASGDCMTFDSQEEMKFKWTGEFICNSSGTNAAAIRFNPISANPNDNEIHIADSKFEFPGVWTRVGSTNSGVALDTSGSTTGGITNNEFTFEWMIGQLNGGGNAKYGMLLTNVATRAIQFNRIKVYGEITGYTTAGAQIGLPGDNVTSITQNDYVINSIRMNSGTGAAAIISHGSHERLFAQVDQNYTSALNLTTDATFNNVAVNYLAGTITNAGGASAKNHVLCNGYPCFEAGTFLANTSSSYGQATAISVGATLGWVGSILETVGISGDCVSSTNSFNCTIPANTVTNAKSAQMPAQTVKCNLTASTANATDCLDTTVSTTAQFDRSSANTGITLTNVPGLSVALTSGHTYKFNVELSATAGAGSINVGIGDTASSLAASAFVARGSAEQSSAWGGQSRQTSLNTSVVNVAGLTNADVYISGTITTNSPGNLTVMFAQNSANVSNSSVLIGSTLTVKQIN